MAGGYICCLVKVHDVIIRMKNAVHQFQLFMRVANHNYLFSNNLLQFQVHAATEID
jgi:hypothetical protein